MIRAEQLVYTTADIGGKKGYQVVAKSRGITAGIESRLQDRFHPHGVPPDDFRESHSLSDVGGGRVAYCHARNIGVGYDGRRDTLCSHVLVVAKDEFRRHGCDTRALAPLHPGGRPVRGELPELRIDPPPLAPAGMNGLDPGLLCEALSLLLDGRRTAVESGDPALAQNLLSVLPPSLRLVQFTSLAVDAGDFSRYDLAFFPPRRGPGRASGIATVKPGRGPGCADGGGGGMLGRHVEHYAQAALEGDHPRLGRIQDWFEAAPGLPNRDRMVLACAYERFREASSAEAKRACAEDVLAAAKGADTRSLPAYLDEVWDCAEPRRAAPDPFPMHPSCSSSGLGYWWLPLPVNVAARMAVGLMDSYSRAVEAAAGGEGVNGGGGMRPQGGEGQGRGLRREAQAPPAAGMPADADTPAPRPVAEAAHLPPPAEGGGDPAAGGSRGDGRRSRILRPQRSHARNEYSRAGTAQPHAVAPRPSRLSMDAERLLAGRRLLALDGDFARSDRYDRLYAGALDGPDKPAVLFTACPHEPGGAGAVATPEFAEWARGVRSVKVEGHRIPVRETDAVRGDGSLTLVDAHPTAPRPANVRAYREFQDAGLFERGSSYQYFGADGRGGHSLHLYRVVGEFWGFLLHARLFYQRIGAEGRPFRALLSVRNSSSLGLGDWGDEALSPQWRLMRDRPSSPRDPRTARRHIQLHYDFDPAAGAADREIAGAARDAARKICSAYGRSAPGCYDDSGRFAWRLWDKAVNH